MDKEYELLKNEITATAQLIDNSRNILYFSVATISAFAFAQKEAFLFLLPYIVIIPIYIVTVYLVKSCNNIGAYLLVFHEKDNSFMWETRLYENDTILRKERHRADNAPHLPYLITGAGCSLVCICYILINGITINLIKSIICLLLSILLLMIVFVIWIKFKDIYEIKSQCIETWRKMKESECRRKRKNALLKVEYETLCKTANNRNGSRDKRKIRHFPANNIDAVYIYKRR